MWGGGGRQPSPGFFFPGEARPTQAARRPPRTRAGDLWEPAREGATLGPRAWAPNERRCLGPGVAPRQAEPGASRLGDSRARSALGIARTWGRVQVGEGSRLHLALYDVLGSSQRVSESAFDVLQLSEPALAPSLPPEPSPSGGFSGSGGGLAPHQYHVLPPCGPGRGCRLRDTLTPDGHLPSPKGGWWGVLLEGVLEASGIDQPRELQGELCCWGLSP